MSLVHIIDPTSITNPITEKLKTVLGLKLLKMDAAVYGSNEVIYAFSEGDNGKSITDLELNSKEFVIPIIKPAASEPYWMGYSLTFKKNKGKSHYNLFQASVRIFKGKFSDYSMAKVFRAEWMVDHENSKNAQPHWHVHNFLSDKISNAPALFNSEEVVKEFGSSEETDGNRSLAPQIDNFSEFHFAMASNWHKNSGTHLVKLDDKNSLFLWTEGCMKYIVGQLGGMSRIV